MSGIKVDIATLAKLARLDVSEEEMARLEKEIPSILEFVKTIQAVSGKDIRDDAKNAELRNVMRADENPHESGIYTDKLLEAAPNRQGNRVAVKQVISRKKT